ncbi:Cilia- and flagella-associated protein 43 [Dinochytrium kinnereticum]|nr:Cilia- and flagella-associated protein 43 [Dinochytrium kinnereticum]
MTISYMREDVEFVKPYPKKHAQRSSIQHWQLRDLISCPKSRSEFIYVNQNNVLSYNTESKESTALLKDLTFSPTSMTAGHGYLAAGGQRSQLIVRQLSSNWFAQTTVGGSINNAMCLSSHQGQIRLMICNNDETIKVYALPSLQRITSVSLPTAVNYCSVSPDGRKLAAVGDSNQVYLYDVNSSGSYQKTSVMTATSDAGFSCAWNQTSDKFAVASQDGFVCVWDIRSTEKLAKLGSKQNPQVKGACRSVKFSPSGSIDLLMYSEIEKHVSYVNLVDARTFNERQTLRVAPPHSDQHISGISYSPDSKNIFVGSCINFYDTEAALPPSEKPEDEQTVADLTKLKGMTHLRPVIAEAQITAFAVLSRESVVAYAEQGSTNIRILKWPALSPAIPGSGYLQADPKDISILALAFSFDGKYVASLSDLPQYTVSIWDWKANSLLCTEPNRDPARYISFDPMNAKMLCTSGGSGHITFWDLEVGYKRSTLKSTIGMTLIPQDAARPQPSESVNLIDLAFNKEDESEPMSVFIDKHIWTSDHKVLATTKHGDQILLYDPHNGSSILYPTESNIREVEEETEVAVTLLEAQEPEAETMNCQAEVADRDVASVQVEAEERQEELAQQESEPQFRTKVANEIREKFRSLLVTKRHVLAGGDDGVLRWYAASGGVLVLDHSMQLSETRGIKSLGMSPDYKEISIVYHDNSIGSLKLSDNQLIMVSEDETSNISIICPFYLSNIIVAACTNGDVKFFDMETRSVLRKFKINGVPTVISASVFAPVIAIGTTGGILRIYDAEGAIERKPRLLFRKRLFDTEIKKLLFDPTGHYLCVIGSSYEVYLFDMFSTFSHVGYFTVPNKTVSIAWDLEDMEDESNLGENNSVNIVLIVLTSSQTAKASLIYRYTFPLDSELKPEYDLILTSITEQASAFRTDDIASDFAPVASDVSTSRGSFYVMSADKHLKLYSAPSSSVSNRIEEPAFLGGALFEYADHEKPGGHICLSITRDWLYTWAPDGYITARTLMEPDKSVKVYSHDYMKGGVKDIAALSDDPADSVLERKAHDTSKETSSADGLESTEKDPLRKPQNMKSQYASKLLSIREKIIQLMQKNECVPDLEKLNKDDFIVDFSERDRLLAISDNKIKEIRKAIEEENFKKRVIRNRLKVECWDSMEVIGQSVKSFRLDPVTTRIIEVTNYPISKRSNDEKARIARVKLLRKTQLLVASMTKPKKPINRLVDLTDEGEESNEAIEQPKQAAPSSEPLKMDNKGMLFDPLELTTNERRRTQIVLLKEVNFDIKTEFNNRFKEFVKLKNDEIIKIEDKDERILAIINELQISETIFHPALDDDEIPDRIIKVDDSEVKVEKFVSPEEKKRQEELKRLEEERMRANQEDNYRERALMAMMGGKLEDRLVLVSEETEKEELVRPEWMSKPKEEMNDEERKLLKEFEKKLAVLKEEQEKYRKALETELKKLQGVINDICDTFDSKLKEFFNSKLDADQEIYKNELKIIKLAQALIQSEGDEARETEINGKLESLKVEKGRIAAEVPDVKKELEKCREEYEIIMKRDKEIERQFKKEFHSGDSMFETLFKLFKQRDPVTDQVSQPISKQEDDNLSPFEEFEKTLAVPDEPIRPLDSSKDWPEGLPGDVWNRLLEFRDKKILSENDVKNSQRKLQEVQQVYQSILDENERIRKETERVNGEMAAFLEYKFQSTYNLETLYELKQGQVEVPQAPVVTDYTESVLLHRNVVEKVNDNIVTLGRSKVDALKEMKEYRKGIHALEWENKMLDFQAEDLVIRTRDIQLLRVTKQMQEYIRGGDEHKQSSEIVALEKRAEYSQKAHAHKLEEMMRIASKFDKKIKEKERENKTLEQQQHELDLAVGERARIRDVQAKRMPDAGEKVDKLKNIYTRRRLIDLAKSQAQDIAILREEVERLRLRTYPAFPTIRRADLF